MRTLHLFSTSCLALAAGSACLGSAEPGGPKLAVDIAALTLTGPDNVCYDLLVENADGPVWSKGNPLLTLLGADQTGGFVSGAADTDTICSTRYGNTDGGDVTYIGTCDASSDSDTGREGVQNRVTVWVDGIYESGADLGDWQDPCEDGCSLSVDCNENEDSRVEFNLTLMRQANQGFFDIAVNFEDIFCSAKFDTCYPDGDDAGTDPDNITLLHGADQVRDWTGVVGFACSAGSDATQTNLLYGPFTVTCDSNVFAIDPSVAEGNASVAGSAGGVLHYGVYRGTEQLDCGTGAGSCKKVFWNVAFSIQDLETLGGSCTLAVTATANDNNDGFELGLPESVGVTYPYIDITTTLTNNGAGLCQRNELNATGSGVQTQYRGNLEGVIAPIAMCNQFNGTAVSATGGCGGTTATCSDALQNQGETDVDCGGPNCAPCVANDCPLIQAGAGWAMPANAPGCDLQSLDRSGVDLSGANLAGAFGGKAASLGPSTWAGANLSGANMFGADWQNSDLTNANLSGADLRNANFNFTVMTGVDITDAQLAGAQLAATSWTGYDLSGRDLTSVNFFNANLSGADLSSANLTGVMFGIANVTNANLVGANLQGASLFGANLTGADLTGADLTGASTNNVVWAAATCPDGAVVGQNGVTTCIGHLVVPTCSDNEQNQGETGVDCGGPCDACPPLPARLYVRSVLVMTPAGERVLTIGGEDYGIDIHAGAELFDPVSLAWESTASTLVPRALHTATVLLDGRVLVTGGRDAGTSAEIYDPTTGTFSATGSMNASRLSHAATLLADGRVLVTGGRPVPGNDNLASAEIYDPTTGTFSATGSMLINRAEHESVLLSTGKVLVVTGGGNGNPESVIAELFDPATGVFSATGDMVIARTGATVTVFAGGVLIAGGRTSGGSPFVEAEVYDIVSGTFSTTGSLSYGRYQHNAVLLTNGTVLITGGINQYFMSWLETEVYEPALGTFRPSTPLSTQRAFGGLTALGNGTAIHTWGFYPYNLQPVPPAEITSE